MNVRANVLALYALQDNHYIYPEAWIRESPHLVVVRTLGRGVAGHPCQE